MIKLMEDRAYVDGFKDVISIQDEKIELLYRNYQLIIEGEKLRISAFNTSELIVFGNMKSVLFVYKNV